jgi:hypothetical protein
VTAPSFVEPTAELPIVERDDLADELDAGDELDAAGETFAPYGINEKTGKPYTRPKAERDAIGAKLAAARAAKRLPSGGPPGRAPAGKRGRGRPPKAPAAVAGRVEPGPNYRPGVAGLLQVPAFALGVLGRVDKAFALDAAAITLYTPAIADAVHDLAITDERVAAVLERVLSVGPYGALFAAIMPLAMQIAANHGKIPTNESMGILSADKLLAAIGAPVAEG